MNGKKEKGKKRIKAKKRKKRKKESGAVLRYMERSRSHGSRHPWGLVLEQFLRDEHCGMELCWSSSWRAVTCGKATHDQCEMEDVPRREPRWTRVTMDGWQRELETYSNPIPISLCHSRKSERGVDGKNTFEVCF